MCDPFEWWNYFFGYFQRCRWRACSVKTTTLSSSRPNSTPWTAPTAPTGSKWHAIPVPDFASNYKAPFTAVPARRLSPTRQTVSGKSRVLPTKFAANLFTLPSSNAFERNNLPHDCVFCHSSSITEFFHSKKSHMFEFRKIKYHSRYILI